MHPCGQNATLPASCVIQPCHRAAFNSGGSFGRRDSHPGPLNLDASLVLPKRTCLQHSRSHRWQKAIMASKQRAAESDLRTIASITASSGFGSSRQVAKAFVVIIEVLQQCVARPPCLNDCTQVIARRHCRVLAQPFRIVEKRTSGPIKQIGGVDQALSHL